MGSILSTCRAEVEAHQVEELLRKEVMALRAAERHAALMMAGQQLIDGSLIDEWFPGVDWDVLGATTAGEGAVWVMPADPAEPALVFQVGRSARLVHPLQERHVMVLWGNRTPEFAAELRTGLGLRPFGVVRTLIELASWVDREAVRRGLQQPR